VVCTTFIWRELRSKISRFYEEAGLDVKIQIGGPDEIFASCEVELLQLSTAKDGSYSRNTGKRAFHLFDNGLK
jgi:hypothetical protein